MIRLRLLGAVLALAGLIAAGPDGSSDPRGRRYDTVAPLHDTVEQRLAPQVDTLLQVVLRDRRDAVVAGVKVFGADDKFLPGKLAAAMAHRILVLAPSDPRLPDRLADFAAIADMTIEDRDDSWGMSYYLAALRRLKDRGLLDRAVRPTTLARLRAKLDWRAFVRGDFSLIRLPSNYYGVAFEMARLRYLLGWESEGASVRLLARTLDQYRRYSGKYGFADETEGEGRYDRYSVLLIAETVDRMLDTGVTPSPEVRRWLRASVDAVLPRLNLRGEGWEYGRSIGVYGDTAILQILTAAARLKVLTPTEQRMAYAFSCRVAARYMDFWVDPATGSVDLWGAGRRTDRYRGQNRVLGENLTLARQIFEADEAWDALGYAGRDADPAFAAWLKTLPKVTTTWFARGRYDRAVITMRDGDRVIALPLVNGAKLQHVRNPYFPIPFSPGLLQGSADGFYPQLLPRLTLTNGSVLMPLTWFEDVRVTRRGAVTEVSWHQSALDRISGNTPIADRRVRIATRYRFAPGRIERFDTVIPTAGIGIARVDMVFATYSRAPVLRDDRIARFAAGAVTELSTEGYGRCVADPATDPVFRSPTGAFASVVRCSDAQRSDGKRAFHWSLSYDADGR